MKKIVLSNTCDNSSLEHSIFCIFLSPMLYTHTHTTNVGQTVRFFRLSCASDLNFNVFEYCDNAFNF